MDMAFDFVYEFIQLLSELRLFWSLKLWDKCPLENYWRQHLSVQRLTNCSRAPILFLFISDFWIVELKKIKRIVFCDTWTWLTWAFHYWDTASRDGNSVEWLLYIQIVCSLIFKAQYTCFWPQPAFSKLIISLPMEQVFNVDKQASLQFVVYFCLCCPSLLLTSPVQNLCSHSVSLLL